MSSLASDVRRARELGLSRHGWLWLALAMTFVLALWIQGPRLLDHYSVEEDMRSFPWLHRLRDPAVLAEDPLTNRLIREVSVGGLTLLFQEKSPGYSLLLLAGSRVVDPILATKLLVFPLLLGSVYYLFRIGSRLRGPRMAFALALAYVIVNLASPTAISAVAGLQRSFMLPLTVALLAYLLEERYWRAGIVLFFTGTIYPPAFILGALIYGLCLVHQRDRRRLPVIEWANGIPLLLAALLLVIVLFPGVVAYANVVSAPTSDPVQPSLSSVIFQAGGRREMFTSFPLVGRAGIVTHPISLLHVVLLALAALLTRLAQPESLSRLPRALHALFWGGVVGYTIAWVGMLITERLPFYWPNGYTRTSLTLFLLIFVVVNAPETLVYCASWLRARRKHLVLLLMPVSIFAGIIGLVAPPIPASAGLGAAAQYSRGALILLSVAVLLLSAAAGLKADNQPRQSTIAIASDLSPKATIALALVFLMPAVFYMRAVRPAFLVASAQERQLYQFLETLPRDVLLGGDPQTLSNVPLLAKRGVLFSEEDPLAGEAQMLDSMLAYYAGDLAEVAFFCQENDVDFLVVDERDFSPGRIAGGRYLFEPYDTAIRAQIGERRSFVLAALADDAKLFQVGMVYVAACHDLSALVSVSR